MASRSPSPPSSLMVSQRDYVPPENGTSSRIKKERRNSFLAAGDVGEDDFVDVDNEAEGLLADADGIPLYTDSEFKIRQVESPFIVQRTLGSLYTLSKTQYLKLDPEYQRDVVWDETRSSGLIGSILQGYFIPPIIFNVVEKLESNDEGIESIRHYRICVDGKQRLTSLQKFMEGRIGVLDSAHPPKKWYFCHPQIDGVEKPSNHNILPEKTREFFKGRMFCCYEYQQLLPSVEETMFQLVQRGMPLTPAEKMRALSTPWANFAKQYEVDYQMVLSLSKQNRASGFRQIMTIFCQIMEVMSPSGDKKKNREGSGWKPTYQATPNNLTKLLMDTPSLNEGVKKVFKKVFEKYQELLDLCSERDRESATGFKIKQNSCFAPAPAAIAAEGVFHVKTFSPLEVVSTAILLLCHMEERNNKMLLGDIMDLRIYLRQHHKDLRLNNVCWADAFQYIDVELIQRRGGSGATRRKSTAIPEDDLAVEIDSDYSDNYRQGLRSTRNNSNQSFSQPTRSGVGSGRVQMGGQPISNQPPRGSMAPMAPMVPLIEPRKRIHSSDSIPGSGRSLLVKRVRPGV